MQLTIDLDVVKDVKELQELLKEIRALEDDTHAEIFIKVTLPRS